MLFLPAAMSVLLLSACATTEGYEKKVHAWLGQPAEQLIKKWGEPDLILPLKNGHKEYQYLKDQAVTVPQQNTDPFAYNRELRERGTGRGAAKMNLSRPKVISGEAIRSVPPFPFSLRP